MNMIVHFKNVYYYTTIVKKYVAICIAKCLKFHCRLSKLRCILRCDTWEIVHWNRMTNKEKWDKNGMCERKSGKITKSAGNTVGREMGAGDKRDRETGRKMTISKYWITILKPTASAITCNMHTSKTNHEHALSYGQRMIKSSFPYNLNGMEG